MQTDPASFSEQASLDPSFDPPPSEPPPQNEPIPEAETSAENSRVKNIINATSGLFESAGGIFKRGGGRPRKDGKPNKLDIPITNAATALPLGTKPVPPLAGSALDSSLVRRCCTACLKGLSSALDGILFKKAKDAGYSTQETQALVAQCAITEKEADAFSELAEICLRKYGVGTQYCPEIGLAAVVGGIGSRYFTAIRGLEPKSNILPLKKEGA